MSNNKSDRLCWEAVLFFTLYTILPNYFALEISGSLPLLTASRALLLLMGVMLVLRRREVLLDPKRWSLRGLNLLLTEDQPLRWSILIYLGLMLRVNLTFLLDTSESVKHIFTVVAEQYALVWMVTLILDTREKLIGGLRLFFLASGVVALIAAASCVADYNLFYLLDTVKREMLQSDYYRLGLLRAAASFNHPVYYGAYCAVMLPIGMYFVENDKKKWLRLLSAGVMVMNFVGLILSNSRGSILAVGCLAGILFFLYLWQKRLKQLFATYLPIIAGALAVLVLVCCLTPVGLSFLKGVGSSIAMSVESLLPDVIPQDTKPAPTDPSKPAAEPTGPAATVPAQPTEPATEPEPTLDYGDNANGVRSRLAQFTMIQWTLEQSPITGLGPNAHVRGLVKAQYVEGKWQTLRTLDMGVVAIVVQFGLLGLLAYTALYGGVFVTLLSKKHRWDTLTQYLTLAFFTYMLCQLSISDVAKWEWVFIGFAVSLINLHNKE